MQLEKELQKKYTDLQIILQQMRQLQNQIMLLNNQLVELTLLQQSLKEFKDVNEGTNILVSVGNGIYANAMLKNNKEFLVNVGANVVIKKDIDATSQLIYRQTEEIKAVHEQIMNELKGLYEHATSMENEINKLSKNIK